jgi:hypothetical protein
MTTKIHEITRPRFVTPGGLLRMEGLVALAISISFYAQSGASWWLFLALLFVPDLAFIGMAISETFGTLFYNLVHSYTLPLLLAMAALALGATHLLPIALIWTAHIGMDRVVGYGLKYSLQPKDTHLNRA